MRIAGRSTLLAGAGALCLIVAATALAGPKTKRVSVIVNPTSAQIVKGSKQKQLQVTAQLDSSFARCERQRTVLLYRSVNGSLAGPAIGKATSQGGGDKGRVTITGTSSTRIKPSDDFLAIAAQRKVKIKGKAYVCKRGVSSEFSASSV
jgi:hypothetical protein